VDPQTRIIVRIPLDELWMPDGRTAAVRLRALGRQQITGLLRGGTLQFVRADVGHPLEWIDPAERFRFWKSEVSERVMDPAARRFAPGDYRGGFCYVASEWRAEGHPPIVLLERHH
jgi:hypothetical protein